MNYVKIDNIDGKNQKRHIEQVDYALRELKKQLKKDGLMPELRRREYYLSPSKKRRFKKAEALKKRKRADRKQQWFERTHGDSRDSF